jgi:hypothetical protein
MMTVSKPKPFTTETAVVRWAHMHAPDIKFGVDSANHSVTVIVDDELQQTLDTLLQEAGASKINGLRTDDDGVTLLKAKSKVFVKKGDNSFPCRDAKAEMTDAKPYGGDHVRLRLSPVVLSRDGSLSVFLNGCQIIEKNQVDSDTGGFAPTDGFDGSSWKSAEPTTSDSEDKGDPLTEDIPF